MIDIEKMYFHGVSMMDFEFGEGLSNIDLMESVLRDGLKSKELSESAADTVVGLFTSVQDMLQPQLKPFTDAVKA